MATQKGIEKWKVKKWFNVVAPKVFNDVSVGEMPAKDEKSVVGRTIVVGLDTLTKDPTHSYTNVRLQVTGTSGEAAQTKLVRIEALPGYIKSFARKYRSIANARIPVATKDGANTVVKLIAVTRQRTFHTRMQAIRKEMVDFTREFFKNNSRDDVITAITAGKFQAEIAAKVKHIANLNKVEVSRFEIA